MDREAIRSRIQVILRDIVDNDSVKITDDTVAEDVDDWHSTNHVRLMVALEDEFHIRFETDEFSDPKTVGELVDLIQSKLAA